MICGVRNTKHGRGCKRRSRILRERLPSRPFLLGKDGGFFKRRGRFRLSYAATKMFTLSVPETCYNAEYDIECPNDTEHKYSYTLQSPDGAMYTVSWEDEAVGNVNVQVINAKTLEKYFNDTVTDKSVEVPGATQSYTYRTPDWFINNTTDSVTFPEYSNTNQVELPFHVETGNSYALEYYINDKRVGGEDMMPAGKYDLKIPISEGTNDIKIYLVDGKGNMKSWSDRVVLDTKAPSLSIDGLQETERKRLQQLRSLYRKKRVWILPNFSLCFLT